MRFTISKLQVLAFCLTGFTTFGCKDTSVQNGPISIAAMYNLSGGQAALDLPSYRGAMLAVDRLNQENGLPGRKLLLRLQDGKSNPEVLRQKALEQFATDPKTAAFIGLSDTDMVLAAAEFAADNERVFLTSGATSPKLPAQVPDFLFLACFADNVQAAAAAEFAFRDKKATKVAVVYDSTQTYTRLLQAYFSARFRQLGGQILSVQAYNESDLNPVTAQLKGADLIYLAAMPQHALSATKLIRHAGFNQPVIGGDGFDSETIWAGQTGISNVFFTTHAYMQAGNPDPRVRAFIADYTSKYGHAPDAFAALGYDTVNLLAAAINSAQSADPAAIRAALATLQNVEGVTGTISFLNGERIPQKSVTILEIKSGKLALAKQLLPEAVPPP